MLVYAFTNVYKYNLYSSTNHSCLLRRKYQVKLSSLRSASRGVFEPERANIPLPASGWAPAESVGCLHSLMLTGFPRQAVHESTWRNLSIYEHLNVQFLSMTTNTTVQSCFVNYSVEARSLLTATEAWGHAFQTVQYNNRCKAQRWTGSNMRDFQASWQNLPIYWQVLTLLFQ